MCGSTGRTGRERRVGAALLAALTLADCQGDAPRAPAPVVHEQPATTVEACAPAAADQADDVVARIGGEAVTAAELDATMPLALYDLDRARHELRATRLRDLLIARVVGPRAAAEQLSVDAWLAREAASRTLSRDAVIAETLREADVTIALEPPTPPVLEVSADDDAVRGAADAPVTVVEFVDYQSPYCQRMQPVLRRLVDELPVRLVVRDLPLPVHRDAVLAAEAAECAGEQDRYWPYHDVLLQEQANLGRDALVRYAERVGLDVPRFTACLDEGRQRAEVEADAAEARRLGLSVVPTIFVNGRYLRGPQAYETVRALVIDELTAQGVTVPEAPGTTSTSAPASTTTAPTAAPTSTTLTPQPTAILTLPSERVSRALADRRSLARDLERPPLDPGPGYEGHALVRVERVQPGGLYELLGLQPGDVVMTVNGALVLDDGDALFDALRDRATVTVQVLRGGLPKTYEYRIE